MINCAKFRRKIRGGGKLRKKPWRSWRKDRRKMPQKIDYGKIDK